jgi:hypothetical protein
MPDELAQLAHLALGRLFRIMSRPYQPGDDAEYGRVRGIILDASEGITPAYQPNYVRDRFAGALGD